MTARPTTSSSTAPTETTQLTVAGGAGDVSVSGLARDGRASARRGRRPARLRDLRGNRHGGLRRTCGGHDPAVRGRRPRSVARLDGESCGASTRGPRSASCADVERRRDPDRTPHGPADASRARPLPPRRRDEGRPRGVLRRDRRRDRPAPARPALHAQAVSARHRRPGVLPQAGAEGQARVDPDAAVPDLAARGRVAARRLHARQRDRSARLDGADELHRHERVVLAGRQARAPGLRRLRPRPARVAQRLRAGDPGGAPHPRGARGARAAVVPEDERRRRHPRARADHAALVVPGHLRLRRARLARARGREPRPRDHRVAEEEAARRARRPPPERAREDDRLRLLRPAEARRAGVHAAALGGARREGAPARLRQARGAAAGGEARRPVRAGAPRRPGARPGAAPAAEAEK